MAKCRTCGAPAGLMMSECAACIARDAKQNYQAVTAATAQRARKPRRVDARAITTNAAIPGQTVVEHLGIARGLSVRTRGFGGRIAADIQMLVGGQVEALEKLCDEARQAAFDRMREHAADLGADAVTGMRFDATEVFDGVTEMLCYGSAVTLRKADDEVLS